MVLSIPQPASCTKFQRPLLGFPFCSVLPSGDPDPCQARQESRWLPLSLLPNSWQLGPFSCSCSHSPGPRPPPGCPPHLVYEYLLLLLLYSSFTTGCEGGEREGQARVLTSPARSPLRSWYLGGGLNEPFLLLHRCDDGDVAHRLVGILFVLGDTHSQESF